MSRLGAAQLPIYSFRLLLDANRTRFQQMKVNNQTKWVYCTNENWNSYISDR